MYLVINGSLDMGAGKIAAQVFQACTWMHQCDAPRLDDWRQEGCRTVVRVATTPAIFERVINELEGVVLCDEGLTEVEYGARTVFCTWPVRRSQAPKLLSNRKIPLL